MVRSIGLRTRIASFAVAATCAVTVGLVLFSSNVSAAEVVQEGDCGDDATYVLDNEGVLTISGTGDIEDSFAYEREFIFSSYTVTDIVIGEGITGIGEGVFQSLEDVVTVSFPSSLESIGANAFNYCQSLETVTIPDNVWLIDEGAFRNCKGITELTLPKNLDTIGEYAFYDCDGLKTVTIPDSVTELDGYAFMNSDGLEEVTIPSSITTCGIRVFAYCTSLKTVRMAYGDYIWTIQENVFLGDSGITLYFDGSCSQGSYWYENVFEEVIYSKYDVKLHYLDKWLNQETVRVEKNTVWTPVTTPMEYWEGHRLTGNWYLDEHLTEPYDATKPVTGDLVLYAEWEDENMTVLEGYSLSLEGDIAVNFYISVSPEALDTPGAKIVMRNTVPEGKQATVSELEVQDASIETINGKNYRIFKINVPAATMTCPITVELVCGDKTTVIGDNFTVRDYAEYIIAHPEVPEYAKASELVNAMLNYGAYSQKYFDIRTNDLANKNIVDNVPDADPGKYEGIPVAFLPDDPPVTYYGSSLSFESKVSAIVYFKVAKGKDYKDYTFQVMSGEPVTPEENATPGYISFRIDDINPANLTATTNRFVIRISGSGAGYNYDYSPLYVMQAACASSTVSENMKNLSKALYLYGEAAKAYLG